MKTYSRAGVAACFCLALLATPCSTEAADAVSTSTTAETFTPRAVASNGELGVWFPALQAEWLLYYMEHERPQMREVDALQTDLIDLQAHQVTTATRALAAKDIIIDHTKAVARACCRAADECSSWTRSPYLWVSVGAALATLVFVVAR